MLPHGPDVVGVDGATHSASAAASAQSPSEIGVPGDGSGLQQRLALPGLGPSAPMAA